MESLSPRQVQGIVALLATVVISALIGGLDQRALVLAGMVALVGAAAVLYAGGGGGASRDTLDKLGRAARQVLDGQPPQAPPGATAELARVYDTFGEIVEAHSSARARDRETMTQAVQS